MKKAFLGLMVLALSGVIFADEEKAFLRLIETQGFSSKNPFLMTEMNNSTIENRDQDSELEIFVAVSFSMPKASLEKLAIDAKDAQIPLVFRGVKVQEELKVKLKEEPQTMEKRYGKHLLLKGLNDFEWLIATGATIQIDPKKFTDHAIAEVPVLVIAYRNSCQAIAQALHRVTGDVSLRYGLETLKKEIEAELHNVSQITDSNNRKIDYNKNVISKISVILDRLGDRP